MDISKSGRVRKKSTRLVDFETSDDSDKTTKKIFKTPKLTVSKSSQNLS